MIKTPLGLGKKEQIILSNKNDKQSNENQTTKPASPYSIPVKITHKEPTPPIRIPVTVTHSEPTPPREIQVTTTRTDASGNTTITKGVVTDKPYKPKHRGGLIRTPDGSLRVATDEELTEPDLSYDPNRAKPVTVHCIQSPPKPSEPPMIATDEASGDSGGTASAQSDDSSES